MLVLTGVEEEGCLILQSKMIFLTAAELWFLLIRLNKLKIVTANTENRALF